MLPNWDTGCSKIVHNFNIFYDIINQNIFPPPPTQKSMAYLNSSSNFLKKNVYFYIGRVNPSRVVTFGKFQGINACLVQQRIWESMSLWHNMQHTCNKSTSLIGKTGHILNKTKKYQNNGT